MSDSEILKSEPNHDRIGVIWGSGIGGLNTFQEEAKSYFASDGPPRLNPFFIPKMIADMAAGQISIKNNLRGPNYVTVSACASATNAIIDSFNIIRLGKADAIVTGGSEACVNEMGQVLYWTMFHVDAKPSMQVSQIACFHGPHPPWVAVGSHYLHTPPNDCPASFDWQLAPPGYIRRVD